MGHLLDRSFLLHKCTIFVHIYQVLAQILDVLVCQHMSGCVLQYGATCCSVLQCVAAWCDADVFPVKILDVLWYAKDVCV